MTRTLRNFQRLVVKALRKSHLSFSKSASKRNRDQKKQQVMAVGNLWGTKREQRDSLEKQFKTEYAAGRSFNTAPQTTAAPCSTSSARSHLDLGRDLRSILQVPSCSRGTRSGLMVKLAWTWPRAPIPLSSCFFHVLIWRHMTQPHPGKLATIYDLVPI